MSYCARGTVIGPARDVPGGKLHLRADCRRLGCPRCGRKRATIYRRAIAEHAREKKLQRFMTLTLDPKKLEGSEDSITYLRGCFSKFRVYLGRRYEVVSFVAIVELQKSGLAHLHVLVSCFIPQAWISESWQAVGGGRIVDIRFVDIHNVAAYLTKYVTKEVLTSVPANKKRISTSRDIKLLPKKEKTGFMISESGINSLFENQPDRCLMVNIVSDDAGLLSFVALEWEPGCEG